MRYAKVSLGRMFLLRFDNKDIILDRVSEFARKEKVKSAVMLFIGALRQGSVVTGPKKPVVPPAPNTVDFKDAWETLGIATIFTNKKGPQIHMHASMGKKKKVLTGCVRGVSDVFLVVEAVVFELKGVNATKEIDPETGINLLRIL